MLLLLFFSSQCYYLSPSSYRNLGGLNAPAGWKTIKLGDESDFITVEVNNVLTTKKIVNVFGVIKGFVEPGRC